MRGALSGKTRALSAKTQSDMIRERLTFIAKQAVQAKKFGPQDDRLLDLIDNIDNDLQELIEMINRARRAEGGDL
jgi:hypothetical protein